MGIGNYNHETIYDHKSIFLPMFCRLSIKDVKLSSAAAADPDSPRVSCTGQVKRNHRIATFPTTHKHTKPKKTHFSTKTLLPAAAGGRKNGSRSCREMCVRDGRKSVEKSCYDRDQDCIESTIDVSKMDPPLPVVKRAAAPGNRRDEVNIWKRRFDGVKIEPIHLPGNKFPPPFSLSPIRRR